MPWNQFLLLLIGGYWFLHASPRFAFRSQRLSGRRLIFETATAGISAGFIAYLVTRALLAHPRGQSFADDWKTLFPQELSGTVATGLLLLLLGSLLSHVVSTKRRSKQAALDTLGTRLEKLLFRSAEQHDLIHIHLENDRLLVGWAVEAPSLSTRECFFRFLPVLAGHYSATAHEPTYYSLLNYATLFEGLGKTQDLSSEAREKLRRDAEDYSVLLRLADVQAASLADRQEIDAIADSLIEASEA